MLKLLLFSAIIALPVWGISVKTKTTRVYASKHDKPKKLYKAMVLSDNDHHVFAWNMIHQYSTLWPAHPFVFYVPYNGEQAPSARFEEFGDRVKLVQTPSGIGQTYLTLLNDTHPDEIVYFALDDRYPVELTDDKLKHAVKWMETKESDPHFGGLSFGCTHSMMLPDTNKRGRSHEEYEGVTMQECKSPVDHSSKSVCGLFWNHHFTRAYVIKDLYAHGAKMEQKPNWRGAENYDDLFFKMRDTHKFDKHGKVGFWNLAACHNVMAESSKRGKITPFTEQMIRQRGVCVPDRFYPVQDADHYEPSQKHRQKVKFDSKTTKSHCEDFASARASTAVNLKAQAVSQKAPEVVPQVVPEVGSARGRVPSWEETLQLAKVEEDAVCVVDAEHKEITVHSQDGKTTLFRHLSHPVLCQATSNKEGKTHSYNSSKFALLSVYSDEDYVKTDDNYWTLMNKLTYSEKTQRPMFVFLGDIDPQYMCQGISQRHFNKPLAEAAILKNDKIPGIMYLDADAWVSHMSQDHIERYLDLSPDAEVFFTQGRTKPTMVLMNGGIHIIKNTDMGRKFAAGWWNERCEKAGGGEYDQPALWRNTFQLLRDSAGGKFQFEDFDYKHAKGYVLPHFKKEYHNLGQKGIWNCQKNKCWDDYLLNEPIQFGKFLILPARAVKLPDGSTIQGMHQDMKDTKASTFCCHTHAHRRKHRGQPDQEPNRCETKLICHHGSCGNIVTKLYGLNPGELSIHDQSKGMISR